MAATEISGSGQDAVTGQGGAGGRHTAEAAGEFIYGRHAVAELLKSDHPVNKLLVAGDYRQGRLREIVGLARQRRIIVQAVPEQRLSVMCQGGVHQGVVACLPPVAYTAWQDIAGRVADSHRLPMILVLDGVSDPRNLGAIIRTAEAVGALGVIIASRRACPLSAAVAKASAGAVTVLPVARVANLVQTVKELKRRGFWVAGAVVAGGQDYDAADLGGPTVLVLGDEQQGISRLLAGQCDYLLSLPLSGRVQSLNVSVAAGIFLYEAMRQRRRQKPADNQA
ncbi:MAG: 23S rRNA (guanosine(2251)-2'-O)-methyltransferase RlmB [Negativicutes bacterium]|nr:23S rRNA (guanosine(2251)-2'-O)-methyltransferase RlmB [Negativicutes bacterium]